MARNQQDIISDLLEWRNPYTGENLEDHLCTELSKLHNKIVRSPSFKKEYANRSGELPVTMISKLEKCASLLERLRKAAPEDRLLSDRDKTIVSDMLEFITAPFYRFGMSASESLSRWGWLAAALAEEPEAMPVALGKKADRRAAEHRNLSKLLFELCESSGYHTSTLLRQSLHINSTDGMRL